MWSVHAITAAPPSCDLSNITSPLSSQTQTTQHLALSEPPMMIAIIPLPLNISFRIVLNIVLLPQACPPEDYPPGALFPIELQPRPQQILGSYANFRPSKTTFTILPCPQLHHYIKFDHSRASIVVVFIQKSFEPSVLVLAQCSQCT